MMYSIGDVWLSHEYLLENRPKVRTFGRLLYANETTAQQCYSNETTVRKCCPTAHITTCCPTTRNDMPEGGWFYTCDSENVNFKGKIKAYAPP